MTERGGRRLAWLVGVLAVLLAVLSVGVVMVVNARAVIGLPAGVLPGREALETAAAGTRTIEGDLGRLMAEMPFDTERLAQPVVEGRMNFGGADVDPRTRMTRLTGVSLVRVYKDGSEERLRMESLDFQFDGKTGATTRAVARGVTREPRPLPWWKRLVRVQLGQ